MEQLKFKKQTNYDETTTKFKYILDLEKSHSTTQLLLAHYTIIFIFERRQWNVIKVYHIQLRMSIIKVHSILL